MFVTTFDRPRREVNLDDISADPPKGLTEEMAKSRLSDISDELFELQDLLWGARKHSVLIVLQGRDAAGKDGTIKHVMRGLNPRGVAVSSFGIPSTEESRHDFLWRIHRRTPQRGEVAIFNRSHYEDVLVTRVHRLVSKDVWKRRFDQINAFESMLASEGTLILKYFLHITKGEQKVRLLDREKTPEKAWKLNPDDWRDHTLWKEFTGAYEDVIKRCSTRDAPWLVVPSNKKWFRNFAVAESLIELLRPHKVAWTEQLEKEGKVGRAALEAYRRKLARQKSK
jgi:PPK2 family polyphosphate:nucleotide phosphotransferase